ncbi:FAD-linked oxidase C-terminal domain-containing protein [Ferrimicrobium acidiphilum]
MVGRAIALGGTISGEHGVGLLKKRSAYPSYDDRSTPI